MAIRPLSQFDLSGAFNRSALMYVDAQPRHRFNADANAEPVQDTRTVDGVVLPLWEVDILVKDSDGSFGSLAVRIAAKDMPQFPAMSPVDLLKPMGTAWTGNNPGQGGFSVRAEGIRAVSSPAPAEAKRAATAEASAA